MKAIDSPKTAALLTRLANRSTRPAKQSKPDSNPMLKPTQSKSKRLSRTAASRRSRLCATTLRNWFGFYNGYDPMFTWWVGEPYKSVDQALDKYAVFLREKVLGLKPGDTTEIVGDPIGREALMSELAYEMIPYTPEELIAIANKEYAWCENEMKKASRELGYGDDWMKALEYVKTLYVEPGKQPELIRELALEAIKFVDDHDLVTIPQLARDTWRMEMMTPERQLVSPFFLGGEMIQVSYPTNTMGHEAKMMSMRGNNIHFSRATVFHELIPGSSSAGLHGGSLSNLSPALQHAVLDRRRRALLGDVVVGHELRQVAREPNRHALLANASLGANHLLAQLSSREDDAAGMHRPAGQESRPRAGQRDGRSAALVWRSYGPLYQCAYLLGGLQLRGLHHELVDSGKMTNRAFHDAVLKENRIPIEMVRASLTKQKLTRDFVSSWKFYGPNPGEK